MISFITDKNRNSEMKDIYKELLMKFFAVVSAIFIVWSGFCRRPCCSGSDGFGIYMDGRADADTSGTRTG